MVDILFYKSKIRLTSRAMIFLWYGHGLFIYPWGFLLKELFKNLKIYIGGTEKCG
jgi:hypothetical protein